MGVVEQVPTQAARPARPSARGERRLSLANRSARLVTLACTAAAIAGYYVFLGRQVAGPVLHPDGDGYLLVARILAGGPDATIFETRAAGYPLLIAPVYWFAHDPYTVFHLVQVVNAVLVAGTFLLAYLFGRRVLGLAETPGLLAAAAVAALPAVQFYGQLALTEVALAPAVLVWLLLLHAWLNARDAARQWPAAAGTGLATAYLYLVHARAVPLIAVFVLGVALLAALRWTRPVAALACLHALAIGLVASFALNHWVGTHAYPGPLGDITSRTVQGLTTVPGLIRTLCDGTGQLWYLVVSSWGLAGVGLVAVVHAVTRRDTGRARRVVFAALLLGTLSIAYATAATLPDEHRVGNHMYGRYISPFTIVWALVGVWALLNRGWRRGLRLYIVVVLGVLAATGMVLGYAGPRLKDEAFYIIDFPEIVFLDRSLHQVRLFVVDLAAMALLLVAAATLVTRRRRVTMAGLAALLVFNLGATNAVTNEAVVKPWTQWYGPMPQLVRDGGVHPGDVVVTSTDVTWWVLLTQQREVYWTKVQRFQPTVRPSGGNPDLVRFRPVPADATVYIAPWQTAGVPNWNGRAYGWRPILVDPEHGWAAWRRR